MDLYWPYPRKARKVMGKGVKMEIFHCSLGLQNTSLGGSCPSGVGMPWVPPGGCSEVGAKVVLGAVAASPPRRGKHLRCEG